MKFILFLSLFVVFVVRLDAAEEADLPLPDDGPDPEVDEKIADNIKGQMDAFVSGVKDGLEEIRKEAGK